MVLETTICISEENYQKLEEKKMETGFSKNRIIACLLGNEICSGKGDAVLMDTVSYQEKENGSRGFRRLHVGMEEDLYEKCLDMRKVFKLSVSFIIALCITKYLDDFNFEDLKTDNYPGIYMFFCEKDKNLKGYIVYWAIPTPQTTRHLPLIRKLTRL